MKELQRNKLPDTFLAAQKALDTDDCSKIEAFISARPGLADFSRCCSGT
jgi:hypothetical protein